MGRKTYGKGGLLERLYLPVWLHVVPHWLLLGVQAEHPNDYGAQARLVLRRLDEQLAAAGIDKRRLLKVGGKMLQVEGW